MSVFFQYNILVKAAELGSLTLAAEALGCTQSNVSHAIGTLEKEFGFPLLTRGRRGAKLTPEGERVLPEVRAVCEAEAALRAGAAADLTKSALFTFKAFIWNHCLTESSSAPAVGRTAGTTFSAFLRTSATSRISSTFSRPTDRRTRPSSMPFIPSVHLGKSVIQ